MKNREAYIIVIKQTFRPNGNGGEKEKCAAASDLWQEMTQSAIPEP